MARAFLKKYAVIGVVLILFITFSLLTDKFLTTDNILNIIVQSSMLAIMAIGLNMIMTAGEIDISFSGSVPLLGCIFALLVNRGLHSILAFAVVLLLALIIALINSILVTRLQINSFIGTTALMFILTGLWYVISKGKNIWITGAFNRESVYGFIGPIPKVGLILLGIFLFALIISDHTRWGTAFHAVRTDPEAARSAGINVSATKTLAFLLGGAIFAVGTLLSIARLSGALATFGADVMLPTMTIAYVGQSVLGKGRPNMWGILIGAFLLGIVNNAFTLLDLPFWSVPMAYGAILILAIVLSNIGETEIQQIRM